MLAEARVLKALRALSPGRTILFITHRPSIVKTADRIVLLEEGRITRDIRLNEPGMRRAGVVY